MNQTIRISFTETDLPSRSYANRERQDIEKHLNSRNSLYIDLRKVETISHSFAAELYAVIYTKIAEQTFTERIKLIVKNRFVAQSILDSIRYRSEL